MAQAGESPVKWIGSCIEDAKHFAPTKKRGTFYEAVDLGSWVSKIGDFVNVYVNKAGAYEEKVARIMFLYESDDPRDSNDKYRALVQWYIGPVSIPQECYLENIVMDFELEVVEDYCNKDIDISVQSFMMQTLVVLGTRFEDAADIIKDCDIPDIKPVYACRYRLINDEELKLNPVLSKLPKIKCDERKRSSRGRFLPKQQLER